MFYCCSSLNQCRPSGRAGHIMYDMLDHPWFKLPTKSRNDPDTCFIGQLRSRITTAGWNQCFVPSWHQSVRRHFTRQGWKGGGGHGWCCCSKIFTARTDSIFSQLNGRGLDECGGFWHLTRVGPLPSLSLLITTIKTQSDQPTSQTTAHTLHFPPCVHLLASLSIWLGLWIFSGGLSSWILVCLITYKHRYHLFDCLSSCKCPK